jgi:hypothetical protein
MRVRFKEMLVFWLKASPKRKYHSGREAVVAEAFALMGGRIRLIIEI